MAANYRDMVSEFDDYLEPHWHGGLVGPDPGAGGKKNRTQRTAAIGVQKNTHLSRDGLQLLIPEPRLGPRNTWMQLCLVEVINPLGLRNFNLCTISHEPYCILHCLYC